MESTLFLEDGKIFGWSFVKNKESKYSNLLLEITYENKDKKIVRANEIDRQDVVSYFKNESYLHSGFYTVLPLNSGKIEKIRLIIENNGDLTANELYNKIIS